MSLAYLQSAPSVADDLTKGTPGIGSYKYHVRQRGQTDITIDVSISKAEVGVTLASRALFATETLIGTSAGPGQLPAPIYRTNFITTEGRYTLTPALEPMSYSSYMRGGSGFFKKIEFGSDGVTVDGRSRKATAVALSSGTTHFVVLDGWDMAALMALPYQISAWKDGPVTAIETGARAPRGVVYTASSGSPASRPKSIPATSLMFKLDGPEPVIEWVDPSSLVPDLIELPGIRTTILRDGLRY